MDIIIKYEIQFHSYWHCGSGMAAGADVDALVVKDKDGLPYIPGKTMKGLFREAMVDYLCFVNKTDKLENSSSFLELFGEPSDKDKEEVKSSTAFFSNAEICDRIKIVEGGLQKYLFSSVSRTQIDNNGIAVDHSLRKIQVVVPCMLEGEIHFFPKSDELQTDFKKSVKMIKRLGQDRNRGLGRCTIKIKEENTDD